MYPDESLNLLLVDDDENFLKELRLFIEDHFSDITERIDMATSVSTAQKLYAKKPYDLIIADIDFTDVGESADAGLEILDFQKTSPSLVVILTTGKADRGTVFRGAKQGAWDFLAKSPSFLEEALPRLSMAFAKARSEKRIEALNVKVRAQDRHIQFYKRTLCTALQLLLSVALAVAAFLLTKKSIESDLFKTAIFLGVLLFSAVFFEFMKKFLFKLGPMQISTGEEGNNTSGN